MGLTKANKTSFKKGQIPWNKGIPNLKLKERNLKDNVAKRPEVREKMRLAKLGKPSICIGQKRPKIQGQNHPNYKGGFIDEDGYRIICMKGKRCQEHQVIWLRYNNLKEIPKGYCIHHKNGNKSDNRIENLILMKINEHSRLHSLLQFNRIGRNR